MDHRDILKEAARILGDRGQAYGGVEESFTRAAKIATLKLDREISPYAVAIILESVKDARRAKNPGHFDSHLDGINYRAFAAEFAGAAPHAPVNVQRPRVQGVMGETVHGNPTTGAMRNSNPLTDALRAVDEELKR